MTHRPLVIAQAWMMPEPESPNLWRLAQRPEATSRAALHCDGAVIVHRGCRTMLLGCLQ